MSKKRHKKSRKEKHHATDLSSRPQVPNGSDNPNNTPQEDNPQRRLAAHHLETFQGPIPPPRLLAEYDRIIPNGAERILTMAESQSTHRQNLERWAIIGGTILSYVGVFCAAGIAIITLYFGSQLIYKGHSISGTIFAGVGLIGLVTAFIYGTRSRRQERRTRDQLNRELTRQR